MPNLALVPPPLVEDTRTRKPNRRKGSVPSNVTQLPTPDPDAPAAARYFMRQGWTALDAFHAGLGLEVCAAMWVIEAADEAGPSCPA